MSELHYYAVRRVNPFQGATYIVELDRSRALTSDGINWEFQIAVDHPSGWGSLNRHSTERSFLRYAVWSLQEGLARFPVNPQLDARTLKSEGDALLEAVQSHCKDLPFAFCDRYERWLLDNDTREPVALLATASDARFAVPMRSARWQAALGQALDFESATLIQAGQDRQSQPRRHLDYLESLINKRGWSADWIERDANGNGTSLDGISSWSHGQFPSLPWTEHWQEPEADAFADYTAWHAPRLLMLALPRAVRKRLELLVESQPVLAGKLYPLYPDVTDVERMKRIRVMGRLLEKNRA